MSLAKTTIQQAIKEYRQAVRYQFPDSRIYLFGSVARGAVKSTSDIDLLVVSKAFAHLPGIDRLVALSHLRRGKAQAVPMDIVGLTPQEFRGLRSGNNLYWRSVAAASKEQ